MLTSEESSMGSREKNDIMMQKPDTGPLGQAIEDNIKCGKAD
jgi:hypothetical protein